MSECTHVLAAAGKPYPRTCAVCGLGPCQRADPSIEQPEATALPTPIQGDKPGQYREFVAGLVKPGSAVLNTLTPGRVNLLHAAVGISGEAGELLDRVKKIVIYNKRSPDDLDNLVEELGDLEFYMEQLRQEIIVTREQCIAANMLKLAKRYPAGYTDKAAQERADKVGEDAKP